MPKHFDPDAILFRQGDPSDSVILILAGQRRRAARASATTASCSAPCGAGEFVGEMGVLEGRARSATVRAADERRRRS